MSCPARTWTTACAGGECRRRRRKEPRRRRRGPGSPWTSWGPAAFAGTSPSARGRGREEAEGGAEGARWRRCRCRPGPRTRKRWGWRAGLGCPSGGVGPGGTRGRTWPRWPPRTPRWCRRTGTARTRWGSSTRRRGCRGCWPWSGWWGRPARKPGPRPAARRWPRVGRWPPGCTGRRERCTRTCTQGWEGGGRGWSSGRS